MDLEQNFAVLNSVHLSSTTVLAAMCVLYSLLFYCKNLLVDIVENLSEVKKKIHIQYYDWCSLAFDVKPIWRHKS